MVAGSMVLVEISADPKRLGKEKALFWDKQLPMACASFRCWQSLCGESGQQSVPSQIQILN